MLILKNHNPDLSNAQLSFDFCKLPSDNVHDVFVEPELTPHDFIMLVQFHWLALGAATRPIQNEH